MELKLDLGLDLFWACVFDVVESIQGGKDGGDLGFEVGLD